MYELCKHQHHLLLALFDSSNSENTAWSHTQGTMLGRDFYRHRTWDTFVKKKKQSAVNTLPHIHRTANLTFSAKTHVFYDEEER